MKMKVRDSGMPEQDFWETLVDVKKTVTQFRIEQYHTIAELGCGYGTFTKPIASLIKGRLFSFDIDSEMVASTKQRVLDLSNVVVEQRDVIEQGFDCVADAVLLFNILHCEHPEQLLRIAATAAPRILITHWQSVATPRGPSLDIRPRPEQIAAWAGRCKLSVADQFKLPPWHFGMVLVTQ